MILQTRGDARGVTLDSRYHSLQMRSLWFALVVLLTSCASNVGPDGLAVGGPCIDEFDCVTGSYCLRRFDFPNGTCTTNCSDTDDCRGSSVCVDLESGVCLLSCRTDTDCERDGYVCRSMDERGTTERASVCAGR